MLEGGFNQKRTGDGTTYQERLWCLIPYPDCGVELMAGSMIDHYRNLYGMELGIVWDYLPVSQTENPLNVYEVIFPTTMQLCQCPFPRYTGTSHSRSVICNHFRRIQWGDRILILEKHSTPFPQCKCCGQQVTPWIPNNHHYTSAVCRMGQERRRWQDMIQRCLETNLVDIRFNLDPLEATTILSHLRRMVTFNDINWAALYSNLKKAHG